MTLLDDIENEAGAIKTNIGKGSYFDIGLFNGQHVDVRAKS